MQAIVLEAREYISLPLKVPWFKDTVILGLYKGEGRQRPCCHGNTPPCSFFLREAGHCASSTNHLQDFLSSRQQQRMGEPTLRDAREQEEFEAGGGGGDGVHLGIELEGPGERAEISNSSARDLPPGCLVVFGEKGGSGQL